MAHRHPRLDFPVYGLATGWDGPQWLDFFEGKIGEPVWAVWLMHAWNRVGPPGDWFLVGTLPAERYAGLTTAPRQDPVREVAALALLRLVNRATPALEGPQRIRYWQRATVMLESRADDYRSWQADTWQVDGDAVPARTCSWAGAWAGFTTAVSGVFVVVVGSGPAPECVDLAVVRNGGEYYFDADRPLRFPDVLDASVRAALGTAAEQEPATWPLHPDQLRLLGGGTRG